MTVEIVNQYRELCEDCRNREAHAWLVPGAAFTWSALLLRAMADVEHQYVQVGLAALNPLIFSAFLMLFVKWTGYQHGAQRAIRELHERPEFSSFIRISQYMGTPRDGPRKILPVRMLSSYSSTNYLIWVMVIVLILDTGVLALYAAQLLTRA